MKCCVRNPTEIYICNVPSAEIRTSNLKTDQALKFNIHLQGPFHRAVSEYSTITTWHSSIPLHQDTAATKESLMKKPCSKWISNFLIIFLGRAKAKGLTNLLLGSVLRCSKLYHFLWWHLSLISNSKGSFPIWKSGETWEMVQIGGGGRQKI